MPSPQKRTCEHCPSRWHPGGSVGGWGQLPPPASEWPLVQPAGARALPCHSWDCPGRWRCSAMPPPSHRPVCQQRWHLVPAPTALMRHRQREKCPHRRRRWQGCAPPVPLRLLLGLQSLVVALLCQPVPAEPPPSRLPRQPATPSPAPARQQRCCMRRQQPPRPPRRPPGRSCPQHPSPLQSARGHSCSHCPERQSGDRRLVQWQSAQ